MCVWTLCINPDPDGVPGHFFGKVNSTMRKFLFLTILDPDDDLCIRSMACGMCLYSVNIYYYFSNC